MSTAKALGNFEILIEKVAAAKPFLPAIENSVKEAAAIVKDGRFFVCTAGLVCNCHVQKIQKSSPEQLKQGCITAAQGAKTMGLREERADGRETLPKDFPQAVLSNGSRQTWDLP